MKIHSLLHIALCGAVILLCMAPQQTLAQGVTVGDTDALPHPSAMLDVQSVTKGLLIPRMNASQRLGIAAPANGLIVYQVSNTAIAGVLLPRGFWYWDQPQNQWIYLGDERTGQVDQATGTIESALGDVHIALPDEGQNTLLWPLPYNAPPTVLVVPEFTSVATPPDISDYCLPNNTGCGANRASSIALYHSDYVGGPATPPMMSWIPHNACTGTDNAGNPNASSYKYLPYPTGSGYVSTTTAFNSGTVDLCANPAETLGAWVRVYNGLNRSFRFFIDKNQDGDFEDAGEQIGTFINVAQTGGNAFVFGGAGLPLLTLPPDLVSGVTKLRVIMRRNTSLANTPCYAGDTDTFIYDFDINVACGGGGAPFYPNDLNWCNVDDVTNTTARISCFDQNGTAADTKYHYKIISHD